jgi:hypothetical protein
MGKKKFNQTWVNQTSLGNMFGLSAIKIGKILIELGLKDAQKGSATEKALSEGYARSTPLKDGTPYFMWNLQKVKSLISKDYTLLSKVDYWVNLVKKDLDKAYELMDKDQDKLAYMIIDSAYDEVPSDIIEQVKAKIEQLDL